MFKGNEPDGERLRRAVIADLPYGVLNCQNKHVKWDNTIPLESLWEQYRRITKPDSPIILFGQGLFSAKLFIPVQNGTTPWQEIG